MLNNLLFKGRRGGKKRHRKPEEQNGGEEKNGGEESSSDETESATPSCSNTRSILTYLSESEGTMGCLLN